MNSLKFEALDEDLEDLLDKTSTQIQFEVFKNESINEKKRVISNLEKNLEEAKIILNRMEREYTQAPSKYKPMMKSKINKYSLEIQKHRKTLNEQRYTHIVGGSSSSNKIGNPEDTDNELRKQILLGKASLERTAESLARSHTIATETTEVGTEVLNELGTQRETLERTRDRLGDTQEEISRSKRLLRAMSRNVFYNKVLLIIIIMLEVVILGGLVYWKFFT